MVTAYVGTSFVLEVTLFFFHSYVQKTRRAAAFRSDCRRSSRVSGI